MAIAIADTATMAIETTAIATMALAMEAMAVAMATADMVRDVAAATTDDL
jgi:hypothetical protein